MICTECILKRSYFVLSAQNIFAHSDGIDIMIISKKIYGS